MSGETEDQRFERLSRDRIHRPLPKRFYKSVAVTEQFGIALDGRSVKTPLKAPLVLPNRALAEAVAAEWNAQIEVINPQVMPLTKLANTAIDRAVVKIQKAAYWSFTDGVLSIQSTTSKNLYRVDAGHTCEARSKVCKHQIARLLMLRYAERLNATLPESVAMPSVNKPATPVITPDNAPMYKPRPRGAQVEGWDV